ncbi:MAG: chitobiase/beta-hexosaminidase C-terminal domain-containing protein, partial [Pseudomonadota bacterium]
GEAQRTPDLSAVIQEIVSLPGWQSGNDLALIITGTGERTAESYNGQSSRAALLEIEYSEVPPVPTVSTPTISPDGGSFADSVDVTLSTTTVSATIYYTTDGSTPDTSSSVYGGPFTLTDSATVNAIGVLDGYQDSPVASASFNEIAGLLPAFDSFNSGAELSWTTVEMSGRDALWEVASNRYVQRRQVRQSQTTLEESYHTGSYAYLAGAYLGLTNYIFEVEIEPTNETGDDVGILFRYQDSDNYYRLTLDGRFGFTRLEKHVNGQFTPLKTNTHGYELDSTFVLKVRVQGNSIIVYKDDEFIFAVDDSSLPTGSVGLFAAASVRFDDVAITSLDSAPILAVTSPVEYSVSSVNDITVTTLFRNFPAGANVDFILNDSLVINDNVEPFSATFADVGVGNHTIIARAFDSSDAMIAEHIINDVGRSGARYIGVGDSITNGYGDEYYADNSSANSKLRYSKGYAAHFIDRLEASTSTPIIFFNEGIDGDTSQTASEQRIESVIERNLGADTALIMYGTNDTNRSLPIPSGENCDSGDSCYLGSYKSYLQNIVDLMTAAGVQSMVASPPPIFGSSSTDIYSDPASESRNGMIRSYRQAASELSGIQSGPDFYNCFLETENRFSLFDDHLHPNSLGFIYIADLWDQTITGAGGCAPNTFLLSQLTPSTVSPYLKQNLIEVGNEYYVDSDEVIQSIPASENLSDARWIMTANDDRNNSQNTYISFNLDRDADVYVAYDYDPSNSSDSLPNWMSTFTDTGEVVTTSNPDASQLRLFRQSFTAGTVSLGGNMASGASGSEATYIVIVKPQ